MSWHIEVMLNSGKIDKAHINKCDILFLDEVDDFLADLKFQLAEGRRLLQDNQFTGCIVVAVSEPMCFAETERLLESLKNLNVPHGGIVINRVLTDSNVDIDRYSEQQNFINKFLKITIFSKFIL